MSHEKFITKMYSKIKKLKIIHGGQNKFLAIKLVSTSKQ